MVLGFFLSLFLFCFLIKTNENQAFGGKKTDKPKLIKLN